MANTLDECVSAVNNGGTILYPTDTIIGLGCDAKNESAVEKIFELKQRPKNKSLVVLVNKPFMLENIVKEVPEAAWDLFEFATKPLTIILPNAINLAKNVIAEDGTVAVRMVNKGFVNTLLNKCRTPLVSTSANLSGQPSPVHLHEVSEQITNKVDAIFAEENSFATGKASTIMKLELNGGITFLRK
jgi:L-threonylcarbamoyladenylate synthase